MDNDQQVRLIQRRMDGLEGMPVNDDQSAREAFTHVMATVSDQLISVLPRIVEKLAGATAFSVSAGATVAVTVDFGPAAGSRVAGAARA